MRVSGIARALVVTVFGGMSVLHFVPGPASGMAAIVPRRLTRGSDRAARALVRITGVCEAAGAIGLLDRRTRPFAAGALLVFLAAVFPANAALAREPELLPAASVPLVPRALLQVGLGALVAAAGLLPSSSRRAS